MRWKILQPMPSLEGKDILVATPHLDYHCGNVSIGDNGYITLTNAFGIPVSFCPTAENVYHYLEIGEIPDSGFVVTSEQLRGAMCDFFGEYGISPRFVGKFIEELKLRV